MNTGYENPRKLAAQQTVRNVMRRNETPAEQEASARVYLGAQGYQHHEIDEAIDYLRLQQCIELPAATHPGVVITEELEEGYDPHR